MESQTMKNAIGYEPVNSRIVTVRLMPNQVYHTDTGVHTNVYKLRRRYRYVLRGTAKDHKTS